MQDSFGRTIDYLRVSVTDRCNFRCIYCMPESGYPVSPKDELLTFQEIARLAHIAADLGITKVRLTGGEPLVRKDLPQLVAKLRAHPGITDLSCTTNAFLLPEMAAELAVAGLNRVNISLDTLKPDKFERIARRGSLSQVMEGIHAARCAGLTPIKINCVLMKGLNDCEAVDFARWTLSEDIHVRFIELMPIKWNLDESGPFEATRVFQNGQGLLRLRRAQDNGMLSDSQMRNMVVPYTVAKRAIEAEFGKMEPFYVHTNGPAVTYRIPGAKGTVGFISQITADLCASCNRLRLTSDGQLRPCLMCDGELDLRGPLRAGASDVELAELFLHVVQHKPERHYLAEGQKVYARAMNQIGG